MSDLTTKTPLSAREVIMREARRLFAARGIDGVSTREIMKAAGQKNTASLGYYFGSKENLVRELIIDGAKVIDDRRNHWLDELEANGSPTTVREVTDIIIFSAVRMSEESDTHEDSYIRFITHIGQHHPELFYSTLGDKWAAGFTRCFDHLRRLMPDMPHAVKTQRIRFITGYLGSVLSFREQALTGRLEKQGLWAYEATLHHFSQTMAAIIEAPYESAAFADIDFDSITEDESMSAFMGNGNSSE